jgi:hypothetical protein
MLFSMYKYVFFDFQYVDTIEFISIQKFPLFLMGLFFLLNFISYKKKNLLPILSNLKLRYWILFLVIIMSSIFLFYEGNPENFIYFQF